MHRLALVLIILTLSFPACDRGETPKPVPASAAAAPSAPPIRSLAGVATCTGETQLTAGVPGSPGHLVADTVNPNGSSELALLMRKMRADMATAREQVIAGKPATLPFAHHRIRCAWPTDSGMRNSAFDGMALAHLTAIDHFNQGGGKAAFNGVVQTCVNCHNKTCGGPLAVIRPLRIPDGNPAASPDGSSER